MFGPIGATQLVSLGESIIWLFIIYSYKRKSKYEEGI